MNCPVCQTELEQQQVEDVLVDVCRAGCGGIWFDNFEFKKFDEAHEPAEGLLNLAEETTPHYRPEHILCPKCSLPMMRHYTSAKHEVEIDECGGCAGVWLDRGELDRIRALFDNEQQREQSHATFMAQMVERPLAELKAHTDRESCTMRRVANMLRFLSPSFYLNRGRSTTRP